MVPDVRPAGQRDVTSLSQALGRAFFDDPVMAWMLPDDAARRRGLPRLFAAMARFHHIGNGACEIARTAEGDVGAATLWDPPDEWQHSRLSELLSLPALVMAFGRNLQGAATVAETMKQQHPREPHWYLAVIGSDPAVRGGGYGHALMTSRLDRCDAEHSPAYLESSKRENIPYYERFGFDVTGEIALPNGGPLLWPMWRRPR